MSVQQTIQAQIAAAKLKPRERKLALSLLEDASDEGYVSDTPRNFYLELTGTEPEQPSGYVKVDYQVIGNALNALCKAGILAYAYTPLISSEIAMSFMQWPRGCVQPVDEPKPKSESETTR